MLSYLKNFIQQNCLSIAIFIAIFSLLTIILLFLSYLMFNIALVSIGMKVIPLAKLLILAIGVALMLSVAFWQNK